MHIFYHAWLHVWHGYYDTASCITSSTVQFRAVPDEKFWPYQLQSLRVVSEVASCCLIGVDTIYMWLSEQKPAMFAHKLKFILLPQLIATMQVHCLHWLMLTALLFYSAFANHVNS